MKTKELSGSRIFSRETPGFLTGIRYIIIFAILEIHGYTRKCKEQDISGKHWIVETGNWMCLDPPGKCVISVDLKG